MPELAASASGSATSASETRREPSNDHREIAQRLAGPELEELAVAQDVAQRDGRATQEQAGRWRCRSSRCGTVMRNEAVA